MEWLAEIETLVFLRLGSVWEIICICFLGKQKLGEVLGELRRKQGFQFSYMDELTG